MPGNDATFHVFVNGQPLHESYLGDVKGWEIRESDRDPTVASLRLKLRQDAGTGEYKLLKEKVFKPTIKLRIDAGAPGMNTIPMFVGFVTHLRPHFERIPANCYVEVLAMDAAVAMDAEERVDSYTDMTDSDAAKKIFGNYTAVSGQVTTKKSGAKHEEKRLLLMQRTTDWKFLQMLARRNGFVCYLRPSNTGDVDAYFGPRQVSKADQPVLSPQKDGDSLVWIDFQTMFTGPVRFVGGAYDPFEQKIVKGDGKASLKLLGSATAVDGDIESGLKKAGAKKAQRLLRDPLPFDQAINAESTGRTDNARFVTEVRGEIDTAKYRWLARAGVPIAVKDVGTENIGSYYLRSVRTVLIEGVMSQTFIGEKNSFGKGNTKFDVGPPSDAKGGQEGQI